MTRDTKDRIWQAKGTLNRWDLGLWTWNRAALGGITRASQPRRPRNVSSIIVGTSLLSYLLVILNRWWLVKQLNVLVGEVTLLIAISRRKTKVFFSFCWERESLRCQLLPVQLLLDQKSKGFHEVYIPELTRFIGMHEWRGQRVETFGQLTLAFRNLKFESYGNARTTGSNLTLEGFSYILQAGSDLKVPEVEIA